MILHRVHLEFPLENSWAYYQIIDTRTLPLTPKTQPFLDYTVAAIREAVTNAVANGYGEVITYN